jgi:hypothetical protein
MTPHCEVIVDHRDSSIAGSTVYIFMFISDIHFFSCTHEHVHKYCLNRVEISHGIWRLYDETPKLLQGLCLMANHVRIWNYDCFYILRIIQLCPDMIMLSTCTYVVIRQRLAPSMPHVWSVAKDKHYWQPDSVQVTHAELPPSGCCENLHSLLLLPCVVWGFDIGAWGRSPAVQV